jgi:RNA polymerase-binding protein DksA
MGTVPRADVTAEFRQRLLEARARILRAVIQTDEELATREDHQPGSPVEDACDTATQALLARLEGRDRHELDEIDAARARLEAGTFGGCERCRQPIPLTRLRAVPAARLCLPCQAIQEA